MNTPDRRGFTLVELIVVAVLGMVVLLAGYSTLVTNRRAYTVQRVRVQGQQALRAASDVLAGELREISVGGGDLLAIGDDFVEIRAVRGFGFVCETDYASTPPFFRIRLLTGTVGESDSVVVHADNDPDLREDDRWLSGFVSSVSSAAACPDGNEGPAMNIEDLGGSDTVRVGAQIRAYQRFTYGLQTFEGEDFLVRERPDGAVEPVVGPLGDASRKGLEFEYFDETGAPAASASEVEWIRITLRTPLSGVGGGREISDSLVVQVHPRN